MKSWIGDIREKTAGMDRSRKIEYIAGYYWYHILIGCILLGLLVLFIYHIGWGDRRKEFTCVIINQTVDYERDHELAERFGIFAGMDGQDILVDSDYQISYGDKRFEGIKESSYEKFFLNWQTGELDAMVMPESFYEFCSASGGEFMDERIPLGATCLDGVLQEEEDDAVFLVFAADTTHGKACELFREFLCGEVENEEEVEY